MAVLDLAADPPRRAVRAATGGPAAPPHDYVPGLDGLRAISVTLVILGHLGFGALVPGGLGVTIFFFISGHLITGLLLTERERNGGVDLLRFYGRRSLRLLPEMAVLLLVLGFVVAPLLHQPLPPLQALAALSYWTNYFILWGWGDCAHCAVTGHLWSLAVEEHFYLLWPVALIACAFAPRRAAVVLATVLVAAAAWRFAAFTGLHRSEVYTYKATECRLDSIAWGCLAAVLPRCAPDLAARVRRHAGGLFAVGALMLLASLAWRDEVFRATGRYSLQGAALFLVVPALVSGPRLAPLVRLLEWAPMRWMGRRSYAAYLWHYVALGFAAAAVGWTGDLEAAPHRLQLLALPLVLALTWVVAELSFRFVYKPAQRLKPWLEPRPGPAPLPVG